MSIVSLTQLDRHIREAVQLQLEWDGEVEASGIGVAVTDHVVTLTGFIDTCAGKLAAERAARRVHGVKAVANDIQVRLHPSGTDPEMAADAVRILDMHGALPEGVQVVVHNGHVTLTGAVRTPYERAAAEKALRYIRGAKGIANHIRIVPGPVADDVQRDVERGLHRDAAPHDYGIEVRVDDGKVTLTGQVRSWHERGTAEQAASRGAGAREVVNEITVACSPSRE
jgi:osmotically-inducible protein OsmY